MNIPFLEVFGSCQRSDCLSQPCTKFVAIPGNPNRCICGCDINGHKYMYYSEGDKKIHIPDLEDVAVTNNFTTGTSNLVTAGSG